MQCKEVSTISIGAAAMYLVAAQEDIYAFIKGFWVLFLMPVQIQLVDKLLQAIAAHALLTAVGSTSQHVCAGDTALLIYSARQPNQQSATAQQLIKLQRCRLNLLLTAVAKPVQDELHVSGNSLEASNSRQGWACSILAGPSGIQSQSAHLRKGSLVRHVCNNHNSNCTLSSIG